MHLQTLLLPAATTLLLTLPPTTQAWGFYGHKTVALLASRYFLPETAQFVQTYLYRGQSIMDAAVWADRYAHIPLGRYSKTWHYIDAQDDPPRVCEVNYNRDCAVSKGGCIVSALVNMTSRIQDDTLPWAQRAQALRFILHFIGDIHQPLHTEHAQLGGNRIKVLFHGHEANLHSIWDSKILESHRGRPTERGIISFTNDLQSRIESGEYKSEASLNNWGKCLNTTRAEECALVWASGANRWVCEYVLKDGEEGVEGQELGGEYADGAVGIIEKSIAQAGYRLAGWMNMLVTGRDGLDEGIGRDVNVNGWEVLEGVKEGLEEGDREVEEQVREMEMQRGFEGLRVQH
ncbi:hypothetical protein AOL_s00110g124 [Orbilia oligospora ATCC 24927]|uniref:Nuclease S1 n=2 Tax=Orbilia oligospora TaxID=2813651 RepID=G1XKV4_ARTOA|nr:hypothetical protein AOL_s00110g124 [Orbilia oligospora ATCC 24927]EGX46300.1 hypothetical protein AOL_s00110g124 [Orbilia oligospora ATCC 24927]KAF3281145.1 hypothetical protein TWF970_002312 [Orbilia oligospora]